MYSHYFDLREQADVFLSSPRKRARIFIPWSLLESSMVDFHCLQTENRVETDAANGSSVDKDVFLTYFTACGKIVPCP